MEFVFIPQQKIHFGDPSISEDFSVRTSLARVEIEGSLNQAMFGSGYSQMLENSLIQNSSNKRQKLDHVLDWNLTVMLFHYSDKTPSGSLRIFTSESEQSILSRLESVCGQGQFWLNIKMELRAGVSSYRIEATDKKLRLFRISHEPRMGFRHPFNFTDSIARAMTSSNFLEAKLAATLHLTDAAISALHIDNLDDPFLINRTLLQDSSTTGDAIIVVADGVQVRCHKGFLSAHSPVFRAMFESSMREGISSSVEIPDMTEQGMKALLGYLYCWTITDAAKSSDVALQLLLAADKYNIPRLEKSIRDLLLSKENEWFSVTVALQLLQFAKTKASEGGDSIYQLVQDKATAVLRSKPAGELKRNSEFQQLFKEPEVAMDFCIYFMTESVT